MTGVNLVYGSLIAFAVSIPQIIVYTKMTRALPRTGGDYVWVSRTFGGLFGSAISFMGYTMETLAYLALIALATISAIGAVGVAEGHNNFLPLALPPNAGGSPGEQFAIAAVIFLRPYCSEHYEAKDGLQTGHDLFLLWSPLHPSRNWNTTCLRVAQEWRVTCPRWVMQISPIRRWQPPTLDRRSISQTRYFSFHSLQFSFIPG